MADNRVGKPGKVEHVRHGPAHGGEVIRHELRCTPCNRRACRHVVGAERLDEVARVDADLCRRICSDFV